MTLNLLWWASTASGFLALLSFGIRGLWREYPFVCAYLGITVSVDVWARVIPHDVVGFTYIWIAAELLRTPAELGSVYSYIRKHGGAHPGASSFLRKMLIAVLILGTAICILTMPPELTQHAKIALYGAVALYRRWLLSGSAISVGVFGWVLFRIGAKMPANVRRHWFILTSLLTLQAIATYVITSTGTNKSYDVLHLAGTSCCYLAWALLMTRPGEADVPVSSVLTVDEASKQAAQAMRGAEDLLQRVREERLGR